MQKSVFIKNVVEELKGQEINLSQDLLKTILDVVESKIGEVILSGDEVTIMGTKFASKTQKGRTGTILKGENAGQEWTSKECTIPYAKIMPSKKKELTR